jgi:hypothetical protein
MTIDPFFLLISVHLMTGRAGMNPKKKLMEPVIFFLDKRVFDNRDWSSS